MKIAESRTFRTGGKVAVELPEQFGIAEGMEVEMRSYGREIYIRVKRDKPSMSMAELAKELEKLPKPSSIEKREPIEFPERPGL
jgi:antitoxin VapB